MERLILSWNMCKITDFEKNKKNWEKSRVNAKKIK